MSGSLAKVAELIRHETGIVVKETQLSALEAALGRISPGMDAEQFLAETSRQGQESTLFTRLINEVTVQETYFFRELRELEAIQWQRLLEGERETGLGVVRVWVAACATGEEAYSLAILASEALGHGGRPPVTIIGTDISSAALELATAGRGYSERSVRNLPPHLLQRYFNRENGRFSVRDNIKSLVRFRRHNLISDPSPPPGEVSFDVIACRNVLIYFDLETVEPVIRSLESALRPDGYLILGAADRLTGTAGALGVTAMERPSVERRSPPPPKRELRRPLGREQGPRRRAEDKAEEALLTANAGDLAKAKEIIEGVLVKNPLMADAYFVRGSIELGLGNPRLAEASFRRALYLDPSFGLAAFELGRVRDATGNARAARRSYEQALRTLGTDDGRHGEILGLINLDTVIADCRAWLRAEGGGEP